MTDQLLVPSALIFGEEVFLPEALALYIESKQIHTDFPEYNSDLKAPKAAILGDTLFAYLNIDHGLSETPSVETYISVISKGSTRDFNRVKGDKARAEVQIIVTSPSGEQTVRVIGKLYRLFREIPGFRVLVLNDLGQCLSGMIVHGAWPTDGEPEFMQKTDDNVTFGFGLEAKYAKLDRLQADRF